MTIKNIVRVEIIDISLLQGTRIVNMASAVLDTPFLAFEKINVNVPAHCEISDAIEDGERIYTSKLSFKAAEGIPKERVAFRITAADKSQYLIGTDEKPFPIVLSKANLPGSFSETSQTEYEVTWKGLLPALQLL